MLDSVVLSELRKRQRDAGVVAWISSVSPLDVFLSVITIGEIEFGIEMRKSADERSAEDLASWLEITLSIYGNRVLPLDVSIARRWGRLAAKIGNKGLDLAIAATALERGGFTVVTRNISDFEPAGVATLDPFTSARRHPRRQ